MNGVQFSEAFDHHALALGDDVEDGIGFGDWPLGDFEGLAVGGAVVGGAGGGEEGEGGGVGTVEGVESG